MDEFFNFEAAAQEPPPMEATEINYGQLNSGPYNVNLAFAEPEDDEDSFTCLQHFSAPEQQFSFNMYNGTMDTAMMGPDDFTDFPRWIAGMDLPAQPCSYCHRMRIHCKIIKSHRRGSCTACVALARSCSLVFPTAERTDRKDIHLREPKLSESICDKQGNCFPDESRQPEQDVSAWQMDMDMSMDAHGNSNSQESLLGQTFSHSLSAPDLAALKASEGPIHPDPVDIGPKVGARFSRESLRILRGWLSTHYYHPYPTDAEKEGLRHQTGLNKTQIVNWLANARRRGKVRAPRSISPSPGLGNHPKAMDIPRKATPAMEEMNPLERWQHSPPENEPASVSAIAKAVTSSTFSSGRDSPYTIYGHTDDGSDRRSLCNVSSTSSLGTSHSSGGSFASALSHKSRGSFGSFGSFGNRGRRRRRRQTSKPVNFPINKTHDGRTFQCTFCTETFKTKHDWQRHEKSLHLSLERWVCCPNGPTQFCSDYNHNRCVFCALPNPPNSHAEVHNYHSCSERSLEERTFYRKDHLRQHLNLVHDVKFQAFSMENWKVATPEIRSRCGFCGIVMDSWSIRVDHLAEHFKGGKSMADWKGDWGFEPQVLNLVENGMPPYMIHDERNSLNPYEATKELAQPERTLEDWVKIILVEYIHDRVLSGNTPSDDELVYEARKVIYNVDEMSPGNPEASWFRDLILMSGTTKNDSSKEGKSLLPWEKKPGKFAAQAPYGNDLTVIKCSKQRALKKFVDAKQAIGLTPTNFELQVEACRILDHIELQSSYKSAGAVSWFKYLITASTAWLDEFRRLSGLPRLSDIVNETVRPTDDKSIDYATHTYIRLEKELVDYVKLQLAIGFTPSDADLQRQARLIVYGNDDSWNQTAADNPGMLHIFKRQNGIAPTDDGSPNFPSFHETAEHVEHPLDPSSYNVPQLKCATSCPRSLHWDIESTGITVPSPVSGRNTHPKEVEKSSAVNTAFAQPSKYFLNDVQCYGRLVRELKRFVTASVSPNNPNQHIPSDAELQNQARWVVFDDDDPWNQTSADNAEWLVRFKRGVGLAPMNDGPGLSNLDSISPWKADSIDTGFSPPYLFPKESQPQYVKDVDTSLVNERINDKAETAERFVEEMGFRYQPPAQVFCSRDLENGLTQYVREEIIKGTYPSDEALRARARDILGIKQTAADDVQLLEKFKAMQGIQKSSPSSTDAYPLISNALFTEFDSEIENLNLSTGCKPPDFSTSAVQINPDATAAFGLEDSPIDVGVTKEYADLYHVHGATSSSLRRRASENMAQNSGFAISTTHANGGSSDGIYFSSNSH